LRNSKEELLKSRPILRELQTAEMAEEVTDRNVYNNNNNNINNITISRVVGENDNRDVLDEDDSQRVF